MPTKHTRRATAPADYNLPPTVTATPLPTTINNTAKLQNREKAAHQAKLKRKRTDAEGTTNKNYSQDDTPRAFARLMQLQQGVRRPNGLDNGDSKRQKKKARTEEAATVTAKPKQAQPAKQQQTKPKPAPSPAPIPKTQPPPTVEQPKILPGESLRDYASRVDRALPLSATLVRKGNTPLPGIKERRTKKERKMQKLYASWRADDVKLKEKAEEAAEAAEEAAEERGIELGVTGEEVKWEEGKRTKRKRMLTETSEGVSVLDDEDPWAVLRERREKRGGLHDVVQAPPDLRAVKTVLKTGKKAGGDVPRKAGGGDERRKEELGQARREVIEGYRAMMRAGGRT